VFPRTVALRGHTVRALGGALHEQVGLHHVRRRGMSGELRELREHTHGDPFKFIAWKATARRQQLMVRDLENEIVTTHVVMVDVGAGMRGGPLGRTPLDWACDATAALAKTALGSSDRVGLVGFDTRTLVELAPDTGHHHYLQLVDRLLDTRGVVDADLTDVTAGELVALVARYLAHQEAIDIRIKVAPPLDDPRWTQIQAGPDGQLYDVSAAARICKRLIDHVLGKEAKKPRPAAIVEDDGQLQLLRLMCKLRGIELPYRMAWEHGRRAHGFAAAVERAVAAGRPDVVVLISDLAGLHEDVAQLRRALARLRRAAGSVTAIVPSPTAFLPQAQTAHGRKVRELMLRDQRANLEPGRRLLVGHGIAVLEGSPNVPIDQLLHGRRVAA
jgi:uncharacterized protein (DUF58 family)